ncbi:hypothetical protein [Pontibacterium sp.]|uniref:hypothetical protein n=1 Tax=Pontibacterium sp. TaxID=2036026 RepID=UPI00356A3A51
MVKKLLVAAAFCSALPVMAADPDNGQELFHEVALERVIRGVEYTDANCYTCHEASYFKRQDRAATTWPKLKAWIEGCNTNLDVGWFPDEAEDVAAYMNREFYKFPVAD